MSDAISGGGNGGGNSDPFGGLGKMLDPLGIIPGIAKMFQGGDASKISDLGKSVLNNVGSFDQSAITAGSASGVGAEPQTDFTPSTDPKTAMNGYAQQLGQQASDEAKRIAEQKIADIQKRNGGRTQGTHAATIQNQNPEPRAQGSHAATIQQQGPEPRAQGSHAATIQQQGPEPRAQSSHAATIQHQGPEPRAQSSHAATTQNQGPAPSQDPGSQDQEPERVGSQSAATGVMSLEQNNAAQEKKNAEEYEILMTVAAHFKRFDTQDAVGGDGKFDEGNLALMVLDPKLSRRVKDAASYLLANPHLMEKLAVISSGNNEQVTIVGVQEYLRQLVEAKSNKPTTTVQNNGSDGGKGADGAGGKGGAGGANGKGGKGGADDVDDDTPLVSSDAKTLDDCLEDIGSSMDRKEKDLIKLLKSGTADAGMIAAAQQELASINQAYKQMYELVGNLRRTFHEMSMHSIGHIR